MHFTRDILLPSALRVLWNTATVELRARCLEEALKGTKTKWDVKHVDRIARCDWDDLP